MTRFRTELRKAAGELDLPRPARDEILMELAAELEAAFEDQCRGGLDEAEAARKAVDMILGSGGVVRRLGRLHAGRWEGWTRGAGAQLTEGTGIVLVAIAIVPMLVFGGGTAVPVLLRSSGSPSSWFLAWLVFAIGVSIALLAARDAFRIARGRLPTRTGPTLLLLLSVLAPALGLLALALGLHSAGTAFASGALDPALPARSLELLTRDLGLFATGLLVGVAGALLWFVIVNRAWVLATREADALLDGSSALPARRPSDVIPLRRRSTS
ncbi:MAG: hypothetical protein WD960_13780 [Gemmatimonadota bacterium]